MLHNLRLFNQSFYFHTLHYIRMLRDDIGDVMFGDEILILSFSVL